MNEPSANGSNGDGRDRMGRFAPGNPGGPGNPLASMVGKLRAALYKAAKPASVKKNVLALEKIRDDPESKPFEVIAAVKLHHEMTLGGTADVIERVEELERRMGERFNVNE